MRRHPEAKPIALFAGANALVIFIKNSGICFFTSVDIRLIDKLLRQGIEKGELKEDTPTAFMARMLIYAMIGTTMNRCVSDGTLDLDAWSRELAEYACTEMLAPYLTQTEA